MYSILDIALCFALAIGFVIILRLQRKFFPRKYYELSRRVFGYGITHRMRIIRSLLIFSYSVVVLFLIEDDLLTISTIILGSFLVVWPVLLNPHQFDLNELGGYGDLIIRINTKGKFLLYCSYILFIISSGILAYLATRFGFMMVDVTVNSFKSWAEGSIWAFLMFLFSENGSKRLENLLDSDIRKNQQKMEEYNE